jgi:hypothetical protein
MWDIGGVGMRRSRAWKHGHWLSLLAAGMVGYLVGDWHALVLRSADLSASQNVALRFPEARADTATVDATLPAPPAGMASAVTLADTSAALLSPSPMALAPQRQAAAPILVRLASAEDVVPLPPTAPVNASATARRVAPQKVEAKPAPAQTRSELRPAAGSREGNRPGFVLNDAQIASIKARLHLSPDQEQMWPAVEAALRNIAYVRGRDGRRHNGATTAEVASLDPYGPEVQGLKSAAVPLIMSFSDEQRSEVRTLAHVMGLDQLASQF